MEKKLGDAELKVMQVLWRTGGCPARQVAEEMTAAWGWNANTTYTLLRRCVQKGAVRRTRAGLFLHPLCGAGGGAAQRGRRAAGKAV